MLGNSVVVLDEIDHLMTKDQEILHSLFEWSLSPLSRLILIGIANALDLTDRFLPRLKARNLKPELLPFHPYSAPQITSVITSRLKSLLPPGAPADHVPFIHPAAIQLCSRKVAAHTGDLRKAFDMCRRGLELLETELKDKHRRQLAATEATQEHGMTPLAQTLERIPLGESTRSLNNFANPINVRRQRANNEQNSPPPPPVMAPLLPAQTPGKLNPPPTPSKLRFPKMPAYDPLSPTTPRVTISHIVRLSSTAFGGSATTRVRCLNLQQKAVLCACCVSERKTGKAPSVRELFGQYSRLCRRDRLLAALTRAEFGDVVGALEAAGVVGVSLAGVGGTPSRKGRGGGLEGVDDRRLSCLVREGELREEVASVGPILTGIFVEE